MSRDPTGSGGAHSSSSVAVRTLAVRLEGVPSPVGFLEGLVGAGGHQLRFTYDPDYRGPALSASLPPRSLPYGDREARTYFDNLLPEGPARRDAVDEGGRPFDDDDVAGLLSVLGGECPGAVMVLPPGMPPPKVPGVLSRDYDLLTDDEVARDLRAVAAGSLPPEVERASLPGVQRKLALAHDAQTQTFLRPKAKGIPTSYLLKLAPRQDPKFEGIIANEALCMRVAGLLGLPVAHTERLWFGDVEVLGTVRYDRVVSDGKIRRLHQEDGAQALGLDRSLKYEDQARAAGRKAGLLELFGEFSAKTASPAETRDVLRRAAFVNWLLGNNDAHMKNFSLLYPPDGGPPNLAPLYDIVSVEGLPGQWRKMAMAINGVGMASAVRGADIEWLASQDGVPRKTPSGAVRRRLSTFRDLAAGAPDAIDRVVEDGDCTEEEARPMREVVLARTARLNQELGWGLPLAAEVTSRIGP